jgi:phosphoglycolate phosphatase-like HAD superfamily hydrolase
MTHAFEELFGAADAMRSQSMAGRTDAWILSDAASAHGIPSDHADLTRFPEVYFRHLNRELNQTAPPGTRNGIMPGVRELLDVLAERDDAYLALLTGNYETSAQMKLERFDLWRYFKCGAFGDNAPDRNGLLPRALARVRTRDGLEIAAAQAIVIGDTPLDVACAQASGARSIGVATGGHTVDELRAAGADVVFEDLSDTNAVIAALGIG